MTAVAGAGIAPRTDMAVLESGDYITDGTRLFCVLAIDSKTVICEDAYEFEVREGEEVFVTVVLQTPIVRRSWVKVNRGD